jgi:hypothetical protein
MANPFLYSQSEVMQFLSMGFNTKDWKGNKTYYIYGHENYSEAIINDNMYSSGLQLSIGTSNTFYPNWDLKYSPCEYIRYNGKNNSIGYYYNQANNGVFSKEYKLEDGKLVYWATYLQTVYGDDIPHFTLEKVEQNSQGIKIYFSRFGEGIECDSYYDISKTELLDIFLKKYVKLIGEITEYINKNNNFEEHLTTLIKGRTSRELAIFRNCLYAIKGYRFANSAWTTFFNKYLDNYEAQYSGNEVTALFTEDEKWLLSLIARYDVQE